MSASEPGSGDPKTEIIEADILVVGGGTGGPMAAIKAKEQNPGLRVVLMEKANVKRSGAISMGMDGLNNAVVPGYATPEQYVKEITIANDGVVHQKAVMAYATGSYPMIQYLDKLGVKFDRHRPVEMHISEIGFCSGHSASGVWVDENARTTIPGLYAVGDMASVPHNYMLGAFVNGGIAGADAASYCEHVDLPDFDVGHLEAERERVLAPTRRDDGLTPHEMEFKTRRMVNDYLEPPKVTAKMQIAQRRFAEIREDLGALVARDPHELHRALEMQTILDCADMAAAASLYRTESRWGFYHLRVDHPETNNDDWYCHTMLFKDEAGRMSHRKREIDPYVVDVAAEEMAAYQSLRVKTPQAAE